MKPTLEKVHRERSNMSTAEVDGNVVGACLDQLSAVSQKLLQPFQELEGQQLTKETPHTDAGVEIAVAARSVR